MEMLINEIKIKQGIFEFEYFSFFDFIYFYFILPSNQTGLDDDSIFFFVGDTELTMLVIFVIGIFEVTWRILVIIEIVLVIIFIFFLLDFGDGDGIFKKLSVD